MNKICAGSTKTGETGDLMSVFEKFEAEARAEVYEKTINPGSRKGCVTA